MGAEGANGSCGVGADGANSVWYSCRWGLGARASCCCCCRCLLLLPRPLFLLDFPLPPPLVFRGGVSDRGGRADGESVHNIVVIPITVKCVLLIFVQVILVIHIVNASLTLFC